MILLPIREIPKHQIRSNCLFRLQRHKGLADPLEIVAREISDDSILLCLDEFMVWVLRA